MYIYVKNPTGRTIRLKVSASDTLCTVKAKIQDQYRLVFDGVQLEDKLTLEDHGIDHGSMLELQEKMQIFVTEMPADKTMALEVDSHDTIGSVKAKIEYMEGFPKGRQCLIFANKRLHDDNLTLADNNIEKESTLLLLLQPCRPTGDMNMMRIFVMKMSGNKIALDVGRSETIDGVKMKIYEKDGTRPIQYRLLFEGMTLENGYNLEHYGIEEEDILDVMICLCGC
ncbi:polyubiquitin-like [Hordeum vulgare subsp. vulgare]|uniref:Ubiquitin-like domain-containing protein n=1 Tax=Hordeum vulgare subsp. vulgare TaxID=112509 RepID=A0A8I7BFA7_HORVV|nr:polyubiquitin-like [Hordeum vulgare subsp. vulgare]